MAPSFNINNNLVSTGLDLCKLINFYKPPKIEPLLKNIKWMDIFYQRNGVTCQNGKRLNYKKKIIKKIIKYRKKTIKSRKIKLDK